MNPFGGEIRPTTELVASKRRTWKQKRAWNYWREQKSSPLGTPSDTNLSVASVPAAEVGLRTRLNTATARGSMF